MIPSDFNSFRIILASSSPRRQMLLKGMEITFETIVKETDELFPMNLQAGEIARYICRKKATVFKDVLTPKTIVITADTLVWLNNHVLNKPKDKEEAKMMLKKLSATMHEVYTGVCLMSEKKSTDFVAVSKVFFKNISDRQIEWYIENYKPFDKAGAYGVQEWIGYAAIQRIEGSYNNVMGLPTEMLYDELMKFIKHVK